MIVTGEVRVYDEQVVEKYDMRSGISHIDRMERYAMPVLRLRT